MRISANELWLPDVTPYNNIGQVESNFLAWEKTTKAFVTHEGDIYFVPPVTMRSFCAADDDANANDGSDDWRFAVRNCSIAIGSWTYDKTELDIVPHDTDYRPAFETKYFENKRVN